MDEFVLRAIQPEDNESLASIIRKSIEDLNLPIEGTAHSDPSTNDLFTLFQTPNSDYFVVESAGKVLGGCGLYPTKNLPDGYIEMVRFFLSPEARGLGLGNMLMQKSIDKATEMKFQHLYIETFPTMEAAVHLYKKFGFKQLQNPLGDSGHFSCNVWMERKLDQNIE